MNEREAIAFANKIEVDDVCCRNCAYSDKWVGDCYKCKSEGRMVGGEEYCRLFAKEKSK